MASTPQSKKDKVGTAHHLWHLHLAGAGKTTGGPCQEKSISTVMPYLVSGWCWGAALLMIFWQPGPNARFGVRLPWTLADSVIWKKSWRLASRLLMVMGVTALISWRAFYISAAHLVGLSCLYPVLLYRWKYGTWRYWKDRGGMAYRPLGRCAHCGHLQKLPYGADLAECKCEACGLSCRPS